MRGPMTRSIHWSLLLLLPALGAGAQEESAPIFIDRVDVDVINVEVFVTDKNGRRVNGLSVDDFEITEDGRPVEISNFYAVANEDRLLRDLERDRELFQRGRSLRSTPRQLPEEQQLNLLVYVDHYNLRPQNQTRILGELKGFLEDRISRGDNVMLVGYNRRVRVVQNFTRDRELIVDGLRKMSKVATHAQIDDAERRRILLRMRQFPSSAQNARTLAGDDVNVAYQLVRAYTQRVRNDLRYTLDALQNVARSLAGLPGRKALLYISDGLPKRPGEALYQQLGDLFGNSLPLSASSSVDPFIEALGQDESHLLNEITQQANAHQVTIYTVDARGLGGGTGSAEFAQLTANTGGHTVTDNLRSLNLQESLLDMSNATGGATILDTFAFENALGGMAQDFDSFYSLGYRSHHGGDGKYHQIKVKVKRPGLKARHRNGFVDKPESERIADRTLSSLILNLEKNPLGVNVDFGLPEKKGGDYHLPVLIRIPFRGITLLPNGEVEQGQLRIYIAVQSEEGGISKTHEFPYPLSVPRDQVAAARNRDIGYSTTLKIRRGVPKVAIGVWDELSGTESFVHKSVLVGQSKASKKGP